ncbi:MAG: signal peptidase I [Candidatus Hydrogenedentes bacterium]|nr:signal peptidase I [Candidatus Hydrogenedentota bacterium]
MDEQPHNDTPQTEEPQKNGLKREVTELLKLVVVFLVVFWMFKTFVVEGYEVLGDSMLPTLRDQDRILVFKLPHWLGTIDMFDWVEPFEEGDIIVFEDPARKRYVKRLIALNPQRHSRSVDAAPLIDGESASPPVKVEFDRGVVRVNNWQVDESAYLSEKAAQTHGRDVCYLHPGEYYVLGDNRAVSKDSRSFHAVTDGQIVGRAILRFWPLSRIKLF